MTRDVGKYVEGCDLYQRMKNRTEEPAGKLKLSKVPTKTWSHLTVVFYNKVASSSREGCDPGSM